MDNLMENVHGVYYNTDSVLLTSEPYLGRSSIFVSANNREKNLDSKRLKWLVIGNGLNSIRILLELC